MRGASALKTNSYKTNRAPGGRATANKRGHKGLFFIDIQMHVEYICGMNVYDKQLKDKIIHLRQQGSTFREIQQELGDIPKASLSYICRNVKLGEQYRDKIRALNASTLQSARLLARNAREGVELERLRVLTTEAIRVTNSNEEIDKHKVALAVLYLGEGRKRRSYRGLSLGGSDLTTLQIYISLLQRCYGLKMNDIKASVQHRADQNLDELKLYWAAGLGLTPDQFYATKPDPRTEGKPTKRNDYKGVCVITCRGAIIQLELSLIAERYAKKLWGYSSAD